MPKKTPTAREVKRDTLIQQRKSADKEWGKTKPEQVFSGHLGRVNKARNTIDAQLKQVRKAGARGRNKGS